MTLQDLLQIIRCPLCQSHLQHRGEYLVCSHAECRRRYDIKQEIPVLIPEESTELTLTEWQQLTSATDSSSVMESKP